MPTPLLMIHRMCLRLSSRTPANEDLSLRAFPVKHWVALAWFQTCNSCWLLPAKSQVGAESCRGSRNMASSRVECRDFVDLPAQCFQPGGIAFDRLWSRLNKILHKQIKSTINCRFVVPLFATGLPWSTWTFWTASIVIIRMHEGSYGAILQQRNSVGVLATLTSLKAALGLHCVSLYFSMKCLHCGSLP